MSAVELYLNAFREFKERRLQLYDAQLGDQIEGGTGAVPSLKFFDQFDIITARHVAESRRRLVFLSNHMENAGESERRTSELIVEVSPERFLSLEDEAIPRGVIETIRDHRNMAAPRYPKLEAILVGCNNRQEGALEVLRHYAALAAVSQRSSAIWDELNDTKPSDTVSLCSSGNAQSLVQWVPRCEYFSHEFLKSVHRLLFRQISGETLPHATGEYRDHAINFNGRMGTAHEEVEAVMSEWLIETNSSMDKWAERSSDCLVYSGDFVRDLAQVAHSFVLIHPFPGGNGRMSRLITSYLAEHFGLTLLPAPNDRSKYSSALEAADRGEIDELAGIFAHDLLNQYVELDAEIESVTGVPILERDGKLGLSRLARVYAMG